jgi:hypothetical protein
LQLIIIIIIIIIIINVREGDHLEDPGVDRRIILTGSSRGWVWERRLG